MTTVTRLGIADGDLGVAQTCATMRQLICASVATPIVRQAATMIVADCDPQDCLGHAYAVRDWLCDSVRFLRDPAGTELLHTPEWMLRRIFHEGTVHVDCDDAAILAGALMGSIGWSVSLVTVAFLDSGTFGHVYCSAHPPVDSFVDSDGDPIWIEFDTTRPMQDLPMHLISRSRIFPVL